LAKKKKNNNNNNKSTGLSLRTSFFRSTLGVSGGAMMTTSTFSRSKLPALRTGAGDDMGDGGSDPMPRLGAGRKIILKMNGISNGWPYNR